MSYHRRMKVEFNHCDPAGIVFYPRYFEMTNSVVENFFAEMLDYSFVRIHIEEQAAVPTARLDVQFLAPSRLGEILDFRLDVAALGRSSLRLTHSVSHDTQPRMQVDQTLVWVDPGGRPAPWPQTIRARLTDLMERNDGA
ncbi:MULTISPECIES: acyl-CoA thioesterase [unclassified Paracoccus (in: a-proteobacteria)]|uniref:acyl-CoA thioesterase n=1 Tax=unclassified Paracoccus (in: a-proteobacteria) TaxID=2688777 RepID=UPI0012B238A5|nr:MULTISPECIES: thioesterase family protein [unclassified Paracoccus (in: a-proteobacteria)]UXU74282.1 acyl-CoA thioesterase [Paracoccus sp. SMMA_5]UXU80173.1 acyl-CoA thioesterase [Paracoccus sp. SMMA_5_TC]